MYLSLLWSTIGKSPLALYSFVDKRMLLGTLSKISPIFFNKQSFGMHRFSFSFQTISPPLDL